MRLMDIFPIKEFILGLVGVLGKILYFACTACFGLIDFFQLCFRRLVGLDKYFLEGSESAVSGDIVFEIFNKAFIDRADGFNVLSSAFISILILGCILLFICSITAIFKTEYSQDKDKKNSKSGIIKNIIKAIASFFLIPLTCYFGLFVGNSVLVALDAATSPTTVGVIQTDVDISGVKQGENSAIQVYVVSPFFDPIEFNFVPITGVLNSACSYSANRYRINNEFMDFINAEAKEGTTRDFGILSSANSPEEAAQIVDLLFMTGAKFDTVQKLDFDSAVDADIINSTSAWILTGNVDEIEHMDKTNLSLTEYFYDYLSYNYILAAIMLIIMIKFFFGLTLGLIQRLIEVMGLFLISPIIISFMPLDNGESTKKWGGQFTLKVLSVYVTVFAMNLFYIIYPITMKFQFFGESPFLNNLMNALFVIAGVLTVKAMDQSFMTLIKVGGVDGKDIGGLSAKGDKVLGDVMNATSQGAAMVMTGAKTAGFAGVAGASLGGAAVSTLGGLGVAAFKHNERAQRGNKALEEAKNSKENKNEAKNAFLKDNQELVSQMTTEDGYQNTLKNGAERLNAAEAKANRDGATDEDKKAYRAAFDNYQKIQDVHTATELGDSDEYDENNVYHKNLLNRISGKAQFADKKEQKDYLTQNAKKNVAYQKTISNIKKEKYDKELKLKLAKKMYGKSWSDAKNAWGGLKGLANTIIGGSGTEKVANAILKGSKKDDKKK